MGKGAETRERILDQAVRLASRDGLDGLTIGTLSSELGLSKSGLFAHFGSKEELQLATIRAAVDRFVAEVVTPAFEAPDGIDRLVALCDRWLTYSRTGVFPGGCFFFSVAAEYDAKPGRVRDEIAAARRAWLGAYESVIDAARRQGEIDPGVDPAALAFEIDALGMAANLHAQLCGEPGVYDRARAAIVARLRALATSPHPALR